MSRRWMMIADMSAIAALGAWITYGHLAGHRMNHTPGEMTRSADGTGPAIVQVSVPELSAAARNGETLFNANCATCHGRNAAGQKGVAPPLVHKIYEPSHHSDVSFQRAAKYGVRAHHWPFGNMPAVPTVTETQVAQIITYVRELQRANGIN